MSELRQRRPVPKKAKRLTPAQREAIARFHSEVHRLDRECIGKTAFGTNHVCQSGVTDLNGKPIVWLQVHHCIPQKILRTNVSTMLDWTDEERFAYSWDPNIGALVCDELHHLHTTRAERIPLEWLPSRVTDFARDNDLWHWLTQEHPSMADTPDQE